MRKQFALTATDESGFCVYYVGSPVRNSYMTRHGYTAAVRFSSVASARRGIPALAKQYHFLKDWKAMQVID